MFYDFLAPLYPFVVVLHVTLCILLVLIILLQPGKGGDVGAAFGGGGGGGGGGGVFGPRGPASLLSRATTGVAVLFMVTSIALALSANKNFGDGSLDAFLTEGTEEATGGLDLSPTEPAAGGAGAGDAGGAGAGDAGSAGGAE